MTHMTFPREERQQRRRRKRDLDAEASTPAHPQPVGSPRNAFGASTAATSGDFVEPLYYEIAINSTLTLLQMFIDRGTPVNYINLDYDELQAVARDSRSLRSGLTNGTYARAPAVVRYHATHARVACRQSGYVGTTCHHVQPSYP